MFLNGGCAANHKTSKSLLCNREVLCPPGTSVCASQRVCFCRVPGVANTLPRACQGQMSEACTALPEWRMPQGRCGCAGGAHQQGVGGGRRAGRCRGVAPCPGAAHAAVPRRLRLHLGGQGARAPPSGHLIRVPWFRVVLNASSSQAPCAALPRMWGSLVCGTGVNPCGQGVRVPVLAAPFCSRRQGLPMLVVLPMQGQCQCSASRRASNHCSTACRLMGWCAIVQ